MIKFLFMIFAITTLPNWAIYGSGKTDDTNFKQWFDAVDTIPDIETIQKLIDKVDVNVQDKDGCTLLINTAKHVFPDSSNCAEFEAIITFLLHVPDIDINAQDSRGKTALMLAANCGNEHVVKLLVQMPNINVNAQDKYGNTALIEACYNKRLHIVKLLLPIPGINLHARGSIILTDGAAIDMARSRRADDIVDLIQNKIFELANEARKAIAENNFEKLKSIISSISVDRLKTEDDRPALYVDNDSNNFIHTACKTGNPEIVLYLLNQTRDPRAICDIRNDAGLRPLDLLNPTTLLFKYFMDLAYGESIVFEATSKTDAPKIKSTSKSCQLCSKRASQICGRCKEVYYCSTDCQKNHWRIHKIDCKKARPSASAT